MTDPIAAGTPGASALADAIEALRAKRGWIIALGIVSLIAGFVALGSVVLATLAAVVVVGAMMIVSGVTEMVHAFQVKAWGKAMLWGILGALYIAGGVIVLNNPFAAATILTLMLGAALLASGVVRIYLAFQMKAGSPWGWVAFSGAITILLGAMLLAGWPLSGFYALGILLGIDLIFAGIGWLGMGLALKKRA